MPAKQTKPTRDKMVIETSKKAAQNAILVVKDELNALPLDKNKKVLLINQQNSIKCPNDLFDHPALFAQLMEEDWPTLQTYETHFGYDKHKEEKVVQFVKDHDYALIICTNFYDRAARPHEYVKTLIDAGYPVLLITNTPYCIEETGGLIPAAQSAVLNMNLTPEGLCTTKAVLHGQLQPLGKWPLTLFDPFGLGRS
ncbi:MAG: hypothetical protein U5R06_03160 [candidate division KSB1 bacterium]|nr:hypothetical protein [candidate division KSB1 bacterium]